MLRIVLASIFMFLARQPSAGNNEASNLNVYGTGENTYLNFYQKFISPAKGGIKCPMYPSCSQYSKALFHSHNPIHAYFGTMDRLLRCGKDLGSYPGIYKKEGVRWYDPPIKPHHSEPFLYVLNDFDHNLNPMAQSSESQDSLAESETSFNFVIYLMNLENYSLAELELERIKFTNNNPGSRIFADKLIAYCRYYANNMELFTKQYKHILFNYGKNYQVLDELSLLKSQMLYKSSDFHGSLSLALKINGNSTYGRQAKLLSALNYINLDKIDSAQILIKNSDFQENPHLLSEINSLKMELDTAHYKSSLLAGSLGTILPGSGFFYVSKPSTGLASVMLNGLFFWVIAESIIKKNYAITATSFTLGFGWYVGSIKGTLDAVKKINANKRRTIIKKHLIKFGKPYKPKFK